VLGVAILSKKTFRCLAITLTMCAELYGAAGMPIAVGSLRQQSDVIAIATLQSVNDQIQTAVVQLGIIKVLQGQVASLTLTANLAPPRGIRGSGTMLTPSAVGTTGIWFLRVNSSGYDVLPLFDGPYAPNDIFIEVSQSAQSAAAGTLDQQLLAYQIEAYRRLPEPNYRDDERIMASLVSADPQDSFAAVAPLLSSPILDQHLVGLAAEIRLGSPDALSELATELENLRGSPKFFMLIEVTESYPPQQTASAVAALEKLISVHSDIPELDLAAGAAMQRIAKFAAAKPTGLAVKAVLPGMVSLLDSKDPNAQLRAAGFLGYFTLFAGADGNIAGTGVMGPFATANTRQFTPSQEATTTPAQYAQFWKVWWAQNYMKFGFTTP